MNKTLTILTATAIAMTCFVSMARAETTLDSFSEVSYLVFPRALGFDGPTFTPDMYDGTITIRFKKLPTSWAGHLAPQLSNKRKQRFFKGLDPLIEGGQLAGIVVRLGIGPFEIQVYEKRRPRRWVMRVGELIRPPLQMGLNGVPIVPYADLAEDDEVDGRLAFSSAELQLSQGQFRAACNRIATIAETADETLSSWVALREADCLMHYGHLAPAEATLRQVMSASHTPGAIVLAKIRLAELTGKALDAGFQFKAYDVSNKAFVGTIADEASYRLARMRLLRGESMKSLETIEVLYKDRPRSPFFESKHLLYMVRWRSVRDAARAKLWMLTAKTYLAIPPLPKTMPHWLEIHQLGATALREVGLAKRAVRVYLSLLSQKPNELDEPSTILELAQTCFEADDTYRAELSVKFLRERFPSWEKRSAVRRLVGDLALARQDDVTTGDMAAQIQKSVPPMDQREDARFVVEASVRTMQIEGVATARDTLGKTRGSLARNVRRDLAVAAGDCDTAVEIAGPIELAEAEDLLLAGACLMGARRQAEAVVLLEAARVWAGPELLTPEMEPLLDELLKAARWWMDNEQRLADATSGPRNI